MNQFFYDMIHLTEGEKLVKYWWLWLMFAPIAYAAAWMVGRKKT